MEAIRPNEKTGIKVNRRNDYRGLGRITQSTQHIFLVCVCDILYSMVAFVDNVDNHRVQN